MWVKDQTLKKNKEVKLLPYLFCLFHFILIIIHSICFISSAKHSSIQQHGSMSTDLFSLSHQCLVEDRENSACLEAATHDNSGCNNKFFGIQSCIRQSNDRSNHLNHSESMYSNHWCTYPNVKPSAILGLLRSYRMVWGYLTPAHSMDYLVPVSTAPNKRAASRSSAVCPGPLTTPEFPLED